MTSSKTAGAAVRTFPTLLKWGLCTRPSTRSYPIGGSTLYKAAKRVAALNDAEKQACVRDNVTTLYHDLGVLAFDGCTYQQSRRIGDILARSVALGVKTREAAVPDERALEAFEVFPELWKLEEETWGHRADSGNA